MADNETTPISYEQSQSIYENFDRDLGASLNAQLVPDPTTQTDQELGASFKAALKGGAGAREDNGQQNRDDVQRNTNQKQNSVIQPQPNILDQYSSYTYKISWFLLNPKSFKIDAEASTFSGARDQKLKLLKNAQLLIQSGGMPKNLNPNNTDFFNAPSGSFISSPEFDLDFYIDNLDIQTYVIGGGTRTVHNLSELKFTVYEPNGITLIPRLYRSVSNLYTLAGITSTVINYTSALYGLLISFYGYDDAGNLVQSNNGLNPKLQVIDSNAIIEKFYTIVIDQITFRVSNKVTEYLISAKPHTFAINASQDRNTIPFAASIAGRTVKDMLVGASEPAARTNSTTVQTDGRPTSISPTQSFDWLF